MNGILLCTLLILFSYNLRNLKYNRISACVNSPEQLFSIYFSLTIPNIFFIILHMAKPKKEIDVTKPLKEPAYEAAAIARANGATKYEAYQLAYPKASYDTARAEATQLLKAQYIDERALQLLASQGLSEAKLAKSLNDCVDSKNETIKLAATSKGFDLLGYGKQADKQATSYNPVQINIIIEDNKAQVPDTIDVTAIDTQP